MRASLWQRLDLTARQITPFGLTFLLVLIGVLPWRVPGLDAVAPVLPLIAVFHWALYRPDLMPGVAVFLIGLVHDVLTGAPMGIHSAVFVLVSMAVQSQQRFFAGKPFPIVWLGFGLVSVAAAVLAWVLASVFHGTLVPVRPTALQYLMTLGCFPPVAWALLRWQQVFLRQA